MNTIQKIPIKLPKDILGFVEKVNQILLNKSLNIETIALEAEIDSLVYKLYNLTYEEVKVIDPEFSLSEAEYAAIKVDATPAPGQVNEVTGKSVTVSVPATPHKGKPNKELTKPIDFSV